MTTSKPTSSPSPRNRSRSLLPKTISGRRRLLAVVVLLASGLGGYLTTCALYPRPLFGRDHAVARVVGSPISEAEKLLAEQGFKVKVDGEAADPEVPAGAVIWQDPPPDLVAPLGTTIHLTRSSGPAPVLVPDIAGFDTDAATKVLIASGLKVGDIDSVPSGDDPSIVVGTRPTAGSAKQPGSTVDLLVSQGPSGIDVPNVVGLRQEEARRQLEAAGFKMGRVSKAEGRRGPPGTVVEQHPAAGTKAARRVRVDLVVTEVN
jgi:serine/threonine-protein kinase